MDVAARGRVQQQMLQHTMENLQLVIWLPACSFRGVCMGTHERGIVPAKGEPPRMPLPPGPGFGQSLTGCRTLPAISLVSVPDEKGRWQSKQRN